MDRENLEDYDAKEVSEYQLFKKKIQKGQFDFEKDGYPPNNRFRNIQNPVAHAATIETCRGANIWAQVPFCGSLLVDIVPLPKHIFEEYYFKVSEIPKIVDFVKETGRLQITLSSYPLAYQGLDYLDPIFEELNPPYFGGIPNLVFGDAKDIKAATDSFIDLAQVRFLNFIKQLSHTYGSQFLFSLLNKSINGYVRLKLCYSLKPIVDEIENLIIDDPKGAFLLLHFCRLLITDPIDDLRSNIKNSALSDLKIAQALPLVYRKEDIRFPCEIGKFLLDHLTNAPEGIRACNQLIDHYSRYDLQKVQESLNKAIVTNNPDIVNKNTEELSEILDNIWSDPTIPKRVKNLRRGVPMSIAAIGSAVSAFTGGSEGFLAGLGFSVGAKFLDTEIEGLSERLVKFFARSYQANVYDFKKKYKGKIARP
jgi:hypothetical protein